MKCEIVNINRVPTKVITWGNSLTDVPENNSNYIICIPGTPGLPELYTDFLEEIYKKTKQTVWIIGHAGHEYFDNHYMPPPEENKELYSLPGQIAHKVSFVENYVPKNVKITLIGHSMGTYIILKALRHPSISSRVVKTYLLFPAIENLAETSNGKFIMNFWRYVEFTIKPVTKAFNMLPLYMQNFLVKNIFCKKYSIPDRFQDLFRNFINPFSLRNYAAMGMDQMYQVRERDTLVLKKYVSTMKLYYGANDNWTPVSFYRNLKKDIPNIDAQLCERNIPHSFIFNHSSVMADMLIDWMNF